MQYRGSKSRLSKFLVPIIQSYITKDTVAYIEPFVGGANIIDKVQCNKKIGYDKHKELIALLQHIQTTTEDLPDMISEDLYNKVKANKHDYEDWYLGLVGFCATYTNSYFGTYARGNDKRIRSNEAIRNLIKQSSKLKDIEFNQKDFREIKNVYNCVIYCDPPYKNTIHQYSTEAFPYEEFYDWCREMSKTNVVLISEYYMPDDFECIWEKEYNANIDSRRIKAKKATEKLFKLPYVVGEKTFKNVKETK